MNDATPPKLNSAPFLIGDLLLLATAGVILWRGASPLDVSEALALFLCVGTGAVLGILPFMLRHRAALRYSEASELASAVAQIQRLEEIQRQIATASNRWDFVQDHSQQIVDATRQISERMTAESQEFMEFFSKADASEKQHLRLEVEKLRRFENDWLAVLTGIFDHLHALMKAALRSGQARVINQLQQFHGACRDLARRVGLVPFLPSPDETFDPKVHQLIEGEGAAGSAIGDVIAPGFTYQGQLLRRAVVALVLPAAEPAALESASVPNPPAETPPAPAAEAEQPRLL